MFSVISLELESTAPQCEVGTSISCQYVEQIWQEKPSPLSHQQVANCIQDLCLKAQLAHLKYQVPHIVL